MNPYHFRQHRQSHFTCCKVNNNIYITTATRKSSGNTLNMVFYCPAYWGCSYFCTFYRYDNVLFQVRHHLHFPSPNNSPSDYFFHRHLLHSLLLNNLCIKTPELFMLSITQLIKKDNIFADDTKIGCDKFCHSRFDLFFKFKHSYFPHFIGMIMFNFRHVPICTIFMFLGKTCQDNRTVSLCFDYFFIE